MSTQDRTPAASLLPARLAAAAALVFLLALHLTALVELSTRGLVQDEAEYLHAGARMARGETLYRSFAEHHPPFFFTLLSHLASGDAHQYVVRARAVSGAAATLAIAILAWLVWQGSGRRPYAPVLFAAVFLSVPPAWRSMTEVRADAIALLLLSAGAALVLTGRSALLHGLGLGLAFHAALWNPKWPMTSVVVGIVFLTLVIRDWRRGDRRAAAIAVTVAAAMALLGLAALAMLTDLPSYVTRVMALSLALAKWTHAFDAANTHMAPFVYCPTLFRPRNIVPVAIAVAGVAWMLRTSRREWHLAVTLAAMALASLGDLLILPNWPVIWPHYYVMWGVMAAAMLALLPGTITAVVERLTPSMPKVRELFPLVITAMALVSATNVIPPRWRSPDPWWLSATWLEQHIGPGDTVFLDTPGIPLNGVDASYYWFGFHDFVPAALQFAATPAGSRILPPLQEQDLPPCRLEAGLEPHLRFIAGPESYVRLPVVAKCFQRLQARGIVTRTPLHGIFFVRR